MQLKKIQDKNDFGVSRSKVKVTVTLDSKTVSR
jgi:hypothetical protein